MKPSGSKVLSRFFLLKTKSTSPSLALFTILRAAESSTDSGIKNILFSLSRSFMAVTGFALMLASAALGSLAKRMGITPDMKSSSKYSVLSSHSAKIMAGMLSLNRWRQQLNYVCVLWSLCDIERILFEKQFKLIHNRKSSLVASIWSAYVKFERTWWSLWRGYGFIQNEFFNRIYPLNGFLFLSSSLLFESFIWLSEVCDMHMD